MLEDDNLKMSSTIEADLKYIKNMYKYNYKYNQ